MNEYQHHSDAPLGDGTRELTKEELMLVSGGISVPHIDWKRNQQAFERGGLYGAAGGFVATLWGGGEGAIPGAAIGALGGGLGDLASQLTGY